MTIESTISPTYGDEENIIRNLTQIINDHLLDNKPIDYIVKQFFYAKCLIAELAKSNIHFKVFYLGAGVRRITTHIDAAPKYHSQIDSPPKTNIKEKEAELTWLNTFGARHVNTEQVLAAITADPALKLALLPKAQTNIVSVGTHLSILRRNTEWLHSEIIYTPNDRKNKTYWFHKKQ